MNKNKLFCLINVLVIFLFSFITHNMYTWFPSVVTTIFPVNESLYEHLKLIYITPIIFSSVLYFIFRWKKIKINNFLSGLLLSSLFCILLFYIVYLPLYHYFGEKMIITFIVYFISICFSQYLNYLIISSNENKYINIASLILIFVIIGILLFFTYRPLKLEFFRDPINNSYGIIKKWD